MVLRAPEWHLSGLKMFPVPTEACLEARSEGVAHRSQENSLPGAGAGHHPNGQALLLLIGPASETLKTAVLVPEVPGEGDDAPARRRRGSPRAEGIGAKCNTARGNKPPKGL